MVPFGSYYKTFWLGLGTVSERAHEFEDALKDLRERPTLSGTDFLPLVVKLDDLFTHLASIRDLVTRLGHPEHRLVFVNAWNEMKLE